MCAPNPHVTHMLPFPHPSPQAKRHLDRFSRFCRAHNYDRPRNNGVIISRQYYVNCTGYPSETASSSKWHAWFASRCLDRRLSTWQMTAVLFLTARNAHCGQRTFRLAWCHEHSAATVTELLQPQDPTCGTLFRFNYAIRTSPTDCSDDS